MKKIAKIDPALLDLPARAGRLLARIDIADAELAVLDRAGKLTPEQLREVDDLISDAERDFRTRPRLSQCNIEKAAEAIGRAEQRIRELGGEIRRAA